ncbi:electron transport complex subunit RsxG [Parashewanella curva]|uniref:Ion-translocating oxidoreductase complex subunit G n=1 Tax=Parashewanella curva TaxID=2338552 RepID=A0A3L8PWV3_9GAMM|nr:electron transport complex subunit RsxG [Parashewanella curva]RLV59856.1 electron transport complex subunit RsxG [Parashewanella curva]
MNKSIVRNGLILALFAMLCTGLVAFVDKFTADKIQAQKQAQRLKILTDIIPNDIHDNNLVQSCRLIYAPNELNTDTPVAAFIATKEQHATAIAMETYAPDGYNGKIKLILSVTKAGEILGVRTLEHNETPGLGDKIELSKSDWVHEFNGKTLSKPSARKWKVKKDGGDFDQFTGATITPRAYVKAVHKALTYINSHFADIQRQTRSCEEQNG